MGTAWAHNGHQSTSKDRGSHLNDDYAGSSRPVMNNQPRKRTKASKPFISAEHKPVQYDGLFRVIIITSGSVASVKLPLIVGELSKNQKVDVQVIGTDNSRHFYTQEQVDEQVGLAHSATSDEGVRIWQDSDEWSDWTKLGDPILHIELRRWADLVVVAPCSANFLAKLAAGLCDNLPLSLLRALPPSTPVILCPAMNTHMYSHPFTADHLLLLEQKLGYLISGPQGAGMLACGDEGPGKMTDWRDIVKMVEAFSEVFHLRHTPPGDTSLPPVPTAINPPQGKRPPIELRHITEEKEADQPSSGYTGELDSSRSESQIGEAAMNLGGEAAVNPNSGLLQWRDIWPE